MIELIQFPWSPFCIVQRRLLEYAGVRFKITNLAKTGDRSLIWRLTKHRYYGVPILRDGRNIVFEHADDTQDIAKYLDWKLKLGLFPDELEGLQRILWRYIENEVESVGFKLNDIYYREFVAIDDQLPFLRHKERKFGRGCIEQWRSHRRSLLAQLEERLLPFEEMLEHADFLLGNRPRFVDFDLFGMLGNFMYSGHHRLPTHLKNLQKWYRRMETIKSEAPKK